MAIGYGNHESPPATSTAKSSPPQPDSAKPGASLRDRDRAESGAGAGEADSTPGAGTLPTNPQGDEVDPGAG